jgi:catechol 2,3-dioxygenase-like lactoylglutathione lyase family enzyme
MRTAKRCRIRRSSNRWRAAAALRRLGRMRLIRIDHVSLNVHDRPGSVAWYERVLGLAADGPAGPVDEPVFLGLSTARLGLFADRDPGLRHIALATDAAGQRRVRERLDQLAVPYHPERHRDHDSLYFRDPDGITLEVMVPIA